MELPAKRLIVWPDQQILRLEAAVRHGEHNASLHRDYWLEAWEKDPPRNFH